MRENEGMNEWRKAGVNSVDIKCWMFCLFYYLLWASSVGLLDVCYINVLFIWRKKVLDEVLPWQQPLMLLPTYFKFLNNTNNSSLFRLLDSAQSCVVKWCHHGIFHWNFLPEKQINKSLCFVVVVVVFCLSLSEVSASLPSLPLSWLTVWAGRFVGVSVSLMSFLRACRGIPDRCLPSLTHC